MNKVQGRSRMAEISCKKFYHFFVAVMILKVDKWIQEVPCQFERS